MKLKYNIPIMYAIACLVWARFFIPVIALFYIASQVPIEQFTIILSAFAISNFLLEIPTGVIADLIGKKKSLMIGRFMYIIEILIIAFFNGFWPFLIAKIISGIGVSFVSGANEAMLYDTLKKQGRINDHKKVSGLMFMLVNISMAFVFIIGAYMFSINPKLPAYASIPPMIIGFILTCLLKEPYRSRKSANFRNAWMHFKEGLSFVRHHKIIKYLILFSMLSFAYLEINSSVSSLYFEKILIPIAYIGIIAFIASITAALVGRKVHSFEERIGDKKSTQLILALLVTGTFLMSLLMPIYGVLFYFLFPFAKGFYFILTNHYINVHIDTAHRATIISIQNMAGQIVLFLLFPAFGYLTKTSMSKAYLYFGTFLLAYSVFLYWYSRDIKAGELNEKLIPSGMGKSAGD